MGWYAETDWNIRFRDQEALEACAAELRALDGLDTEIRDNGILVKDSDGSPLDVLQCMVGSFNEDFDVNLGEDDPLTMYAWGGGKAWEIGPPPDIRPYGRGEANWGGIGVYPILAKYCTGTVDWSCDGSFWRVRFFGDGTYAQYDGQITYPKDPG